MKTKDLVFTALFMAIVFMLGLWPNLGFIAIGPASITIVHIPVIIGAIFLGAKSGLLIGLAFGLGSFFNSMSSGVLFAPIFANPIVSVLPRIVFGFLTYYVYKLVSVFIKQESVSYGVSAALATLLHSAMVVPLLFYFGMNNPNIAGALVQFYQGKLFLFIAGIFMANTLMEMIAATVLVPIVLKALNRIER